MISRGNYSFPYSGARLCLDVSGKTADALAEVDDRWGARAAWASKAHLELESRMLPAVDDERRGMEYEEIAMSESGVHEGGCLCGEIRWRASAEPLYAIHCHCQQCHKHTGSALGAA